MADLTHDDIDQWRRWFEQIAPEFQDGLPVGCYALCDMAGKYLRAVQSETTESAEVAAELARAIEKFPTWPTDPLHALAVLGEEFGELTKAMLQLTYEPHKSSALDVRKEALQTAAMAMRLYRSLDRYEYRPGEQHEQQR